MPALGLLLEYPIFESYNRRVDGANANLTVDSPEYRAPLDFEAHRPAIDAFKQTYIYENMRAIEDQTGLCVSDSILSDMCVLGLRFPGMQVRRMGAAHRRLRG